jgi:hypothetical protein
MIKTKKLKLKPSARDNRRYFIVSTTKEDTEKILLEYLGILGFAKSSYKSVTEEKIQNKTVGSCLSKSLNDVRTALALEGIKIEKVSGTIAGLTR